MTPNLTAAMAGQGGPAAGLRHVSVAAGDFGEPTPSGFCGDTVFRRVLRAGLVRLERLKVVG